MFVGPVKGSVFEFPESHENPARTVVLQLFHNMNSSSGIFEIGLGAEHGAINCKIYSNGATQFTHQDPLRNASDEMVF